jgi:hypothetical protein
MTRINYEPLNVAEKEIRLLVISPGPRWPKWEKMNDVQGTISTSERAAAHDGKAAATTQTTTGLIDPLSEDPWDRAVAQLINMGFSAEHSRQALLESDCSNSDNTFDDNTFDLDVAVDWILTNPRPEEIPGNLFVSIQ